VKKKKNIYKIEKKIFFETPMKILIFICLLLLSIISAEKTTAVVRGGFFIFSFEKKKFQILI